jgi:hypothetical protein
MSDEKKYDGWGFNIKEQTIDIFETGLTNPIYTLTMDELLEKAGFIRRKK